MFAGGLEEEVDTAFSADATSGSLIVTDGPFVETTEVLGELTVVDVADDEAARMWAGKFAEACGWPQEVRRFGPVPRTRVMPSRLCQPSSLGAPTPGGQESSGPYVVRSSQESRGSSVAARSGASP